MTIYLDNAATTPLDGEVLEEMLPYLTKLCGNPSSVHRYGAQSKSAIEKARKKIASLFHVSPAEIIFTSGGTEGNNMLLRGSIEAMQIKHVLTSPLEHPSVRMPLERLAQQGKITLTYVVVNESGDVMLEAVAQWLHNHANGLVSLMHVNHEIGTITDIEAIGRLCQEYAACFHVDMVQSIYCFEHDFHTLPIHLATGSGHKVHGPKGIGFVYIAPQANITPMILGGGQELNMRSGTENVANIVGLAKAIEIVFRDRKQVVAHLLSLKAHMIAFLRRHMPNIAFHGHSDSLTKSSPHLLNILLPLHEANDMLIYNLDIAGIAASTGSACASGSNMSSDVIKALHSAEQYALRFSFSKYNTVAEVEEAAAKLAHLSVNRSSR